MLMLKSDRWMISLFVVETKNKPIGSVLEAILVTTLVMGAMPLNSLALQCPKSGQ